MLNDAEFGVENLPNRISRLEFTQLYPIKTLVSSENRLIICCLQVRVCRVFGIKSH